jgi:uncharacterized protein (DUF4415 family)
MVETAVDLLVFDSDVGKMQLVVEIRQVVRPRPVFDLVRCAIRTSIDIVPGCVALVQPALVLALEFVIEDHPIDAGLARLQLFRFSQIGLVDGRAARQGPRTRAARGIDFSDIPEASDEQLKAMRRVGRPPLGDVARHLIAIRIDPEVLSRFRKEAKRRKVGYQTLINEVLADYVHKHVA